jgi:hypothetical protein
MICCYVDFQLLRAFVKLLAQIIYHSNVSTYRDCSKPMSPTNDTTEPLFDEIELEDQEPLDASLGSLEEG